MSLVCKKYEYTPKGLVEVDTSKNKDLKIGTIIRWGGNMGWSPENFVIIEKITNDWGVHYKCIATKDLRYSTIENSSIKTEDDPNIWHRQHYFIQSELMSESELKEIKFKAENKKINEEKQQDILRKERENFIKLGEIEFKKLAPNNCKNVIVANHNINDSDSMTDYFAEHTEKTIVLGFSKHSRNLFPEMRKAAAKYEPTQHLSIKPELDDGGDKKTEENKDWWTASDEHRENYSMGAGTYLKSGRAYGGIEVRKVGVSEQIYESLGRYGFQGKLRVDKNE